MRPSLVKSFRWLFVVAILFSAGCERSGEEETELVMFCAAGIKAPVTRIASNFSEETGVPVRLQFAGSGTLLSSLQVAPGDIYLAADQSYIDEAKKKNLITATFPVAEMKAGFGVVTGNPKGIRSLEDLRRPGVRSAIGNPDAASIGRFTRKILSKHGAWEGFQPTALFPTVNELGNAIKLGTVDVVIIWDAVARQYPEVEFVPVPEFDAETKHVTAAVTTGAKQPEAASRFCRYLADPEKGQPIFREEGFAMPHHE